MPELLVADKVTREFVTGGSLFGQEKMVALQDFSLALQEERPTVIAIAGESGSGKTTLARVLLGIIPPTSGRISYKGRDLHEMNKQEQKTFRQEVQAIFQDPFEVYNPFYKVDHVLTTPLAKFGLARNKTEATEQINDALRKVGLRPEETLGRYPHQVSGGQRQRIMIARALLLRPRMILADEPVSMVDASLRATILESLLKLHQDFNISLLYITHDLTTAYQLCESIVILYRGSVVEVGSVDLVIKQPKHPYTQLLVNSIPLPDPDQRWGGEDMVTPKVDLTITPSENGCKFAARCPYVMDICLKDQPPLFATDSKRSVACYLHQDVSAEEISSPTTSPIT